MIVAPIVAFATNVIRVATLVLNPHSDIHSIHNLQGILMLLVGLTLIYFIDGWLARGLGSRDPESADTDYGRREVDVTSRATRAFSLGGIVLVLFAMLAMNQFMPRWPVEGRLEETPHQLMARVFGEDPMAPYAVDYNFMGSVQYLAHARHGVEVAGNRVEIHLGVANEGLRQHSILSKRLAWPASGFIPIEEGFVELGSNGPPEFCAGRVSGANGFEKPRPWIEVPSRALGICLLCGCRHTWAPQSRGWRTPKRESIASGSVWRPRSRATPCGVRGNPDDPPLESPMSHTLSTPEERFYHFTVRVNKNNSKINYLQYE